MVIPLPPKLEELPAGYKLVAGRGLSTVLADMDFETFSEAGYIKTDTEKGIVFRAPKGATKKGLPAVGMRVYAEHPSCEVLSLAYNLKDGKGKRLWYPHLPAPQDLFDYINNGGLIEAHNSGFEQCIWECVCNPRMGWPEIKQEQYRCSAAKCRAFGLPGALGPVGDVLDIKNKKDKEGTRLINKFCIPRKPTKKDPRLRIRPEEDTVDGSKLHLYCLRDIEAESEVSSKVPDLIPSELEYWQVDQKINRRGVGVDMLFVKGGMSVIEQAYDKYESELPDLTGGVVTKSSQTLKIKAWADSDFDIQFGSMDQDAVGSALKREDLPPALRRVLEIRALTGSAAVKKLYAVARIVGREGRVHDMFMYHGARTGRAAGSGAQPQNFPNSGPDMALCECGTYFRPSRNNCPSCNCDRSLCSVVEWCAESAEQAIEIIQAGDLATVEDWYGDAIKTVSGCLRGVFLAPEGKDFVSSDYSAIEAVVAAVLAGETWRIEAFKAKKDIYLASISQMTGISYEEYMGHKKSTGSHHPHRKIGKVAELASGYGGWLGAWLNFGADKFFSGDDEIKKNILAWRESSPNIVEMWGGQARGFGWNKVPGLYGLEGMAIAAVSNPGVEYRYRDITYVVTDDVLYCYLPSGRAICYHSPRLNPSSRRRGELALSFMGWNSNPQMGPMGWVSMGTYGGKLFENVIQAVARDIMTFATVNSEKSGYPVVLHIHDELVAEVDEGYGTVEEFEVMMSTMPDWAEGWPIRASGGWRGKRYRKD